MEPKERKFWSSLFNREVTIKYSPINLGPMRPANPESAAALEESRRFFEQINPLVKEAFAKYSK